MIIYKFFEFGKHDHYMLKTQLMSRKSSNLKIITTKLTQEIKLNRKQKE